MLTSPPMIALIIGKYACLNYYKNFPRINIQRYFLFQLIVPTIGASGPC